MQLNVFSTRLCLFADPFERFKDRLQLLLVWKKFFLKHTPVLEKGLELSLMPEVGFKLFVPALHGFWLVLGSGLCGSPINTPNPPKIAKV
jgi:hypothetical protein